MLVATRCLLVIKLVRSPNNFRTRCRILSTSSSSVQPLSRFSNITPSIKQKLGANLHLVEHHPLRIIKDRIEDFCKAWAVQRGHPQFKTFDSLDPVVSTQACFDDLLVPPEHPSRSKSDTYYVDESRVLRTHTSAHQTTLIRSGEAAFLCSGDVYRRDEVDSTHYPVFHQMEGVRIYSLRDLSDSSASLATAKQQAEADLKELLSGLAKHLFGDVRCRWREDYFPFTQPSFELEVEFNGEWLEVLGCGVVHDQVLRNALPERVDTELVVGWAFGLGLERLAMILFKIPDIRLFWSQDKRFLSQFTNHSAQFVPYSKYPPCYKDVSFWLPGPAESFHVNDVYEVIREEAGDLVESVVLFDQFTSGKGRVSHAYRVNYRHLDRSLTNEEVDAVQQRVRRVLAEALSVTLR